MNFEISSFISPALTAVALPCAPSTRSISCHLTCGLESPPNIPRRAFLSVSALALASTILQSADAASRCLSASTVSSVLEDAQYPPAWPYSESDFERFDRTSDSLFYSFPRLTRHIDDDAASALRRYCARNIAPDARDVLDLCASIESYLPNRDVWRNRRRVAGLGMNTHELESNMSLTDFSVHDLNKDPKLPYESSSFDSVLCALSIDYLIHPLEVCAEVARVLRPNGKFIVAFSDRVFSTKAVALWMAGGNEDHVYTVGSYLHFTRAFDNIMATDLSPRRLGACTGDPLYVVSAVRKP